MSFKHHSTVNALTNPVSSGDIVQAESGELYQVMQNMSGEYWLRHVRSGTDITSPAPGQISIVRHIADLINL